MEDEFAAEGEMLVMQNKAARTELLDIMAAVDDLEADAEHDAKQEHEQNREEIRNKKIVIPYCSTKDNECLQTCLPSPWDRSSSTATLRT